MYATLTPDEAILLPYMQVASAADVLASARTQPANILRPSVPDTPAAPKNETAPALPAAVAQQPQAQKDVDKDAE